VNVRDHSTTCDGCLDQGVELFVSSDGELQVSWCNSLDLQVFGSVAGKLQHFSSEVLEDSSAINCGGGSNSAVGAYSALEESMDSSDWELFNNLSDKFIINTTMKTNASAAPSKRMSSRTLDPRHRSWREDQVSPHEKVLT